MAEDFDVIVVGAGAIGLACAAALAQTLGSRRRIAVIDAGDSPSEPEDGIRTLRVSALSPASTALLRSLGSWASAESLFAQPYRSMQVWDASMAQADAIHFDTSGLGVESLGHIVPNDRVTHALYRSVSESPCEVFWNTRIAGLHISPGGARVETDKKDFNAQLVIGADGSQSRVRQLAEFDFSRRNFRQRAFVCHVDSERSHQETAFQRFTPIGPIALLPLCDGRASIVYSVDEKTYSILMNSAERELNTLLSEASDHVLGRLRLASKRAGFPLLSMQLSKTWQRRVLLVGDAAHQVHPLAGQGANLGFADIHALQTVFSLLGAADDLGDEGPLRRLHRQRQAEVMAMQATLESLHRLFTHPADSIRRLRAGGLRLANQSDRLKAALARQAMGLH